MAQSKSFAGIMLVLHVLSLIIYIRPSQAAIDASMESSEGTGYVFHDFFSIQALPEPEGESIPSPAGLASRSGLSDDLELRLTTGPPSSTHLTLPPIQSLVDGKGKRVVPKTSKNEAFWNPTTIIIVTKVEESTGRPECHVTLKPSDGPELSNQYPEEKMLLDQLDECQKPCEQIDKKKRLQTVTLPFSFLTRWARHIFENSGSNPYGKSKFVYTSDNILPRLDKALLTKRDTQRFDVATDRGKEELLDLKLPSILFSDGITLHPSMYRFRQHQTLSSSKPQKATVSNLNNEVEQAEDELPRYAPITPINVRTKPGSKRRKLIPTSRKNKRQKLLHIKTSDKLQAAEAWINFSLPATIHNIRLFYAIFPHLAKESGKTVRQLQWDAWCFYYIFFNKIEVLYRPGEGKKLWQAKSVMVHEMMVTLIDRIAKWPTTSVMLSYKGSSVSHRMLALWLSYKHHSFYRGFCIGQGGLNQRITTMINGLLIEF